jgi:hypothetical protein
LDIDLGNYHGHHFVHGDMSRHQRIGFIDFEVGRQGRPVEASRLVKSLQSLQIGAKSHRIKHRAIFPKAIPGPLFGCHQLTKFVF